MTIKEEYCTKSELKNRGWTTKMIEIFRLVPDVVKPNPYRKSMNMYLYSIEKLNTIENSSDWKFYFNKIKASREKKSSSMKVLSKNRKDDLCDMMNNIEIILPQLSLDQLEKNSLYSVNQYRLSQSINYDKPFDPINGSCDNATMKRFCVNYLRHNSNYDAIIQNMKGKIGNKEAYSNLKNNVLDEIKKQYPHLQQECDRQKINF